MEPNPFEAEVVAFEETDRMNFPPAGATLFMGSSTIALWHTLAQDMAPLTTIRRGYGGSCIADAVYFADRIAIPYKPARILLYAGDNDVACGKDARAIVADYSAFINKIHTALPATKVDFISIKPSSSRLEMWPVMQDVNKRIRGLSYGVGWLGYVDITPVMYDAKGIIHPEFFIEDGLHMSPAGYAAWTKVIKAYLRG